MDVLIFVLMGLSFLAGVVLGFTIAFQMTEVVEDDDDDD